MNIQILSPMSYIEILGNTQQVQPTYNVNLRTVIPAALCWKTSWNVKVNLVSSKPQWASVMLKERDVTRIRHMEIAPTGSSAGKGKCFQPWFLTEPCASAFSWFFWTPQSPSGQGLFLFVLPDISGQTLVIPTSKS